MANAPPRIYARKSKNIAHAVVSKASGVADYVSEARVKAGAFASPVASSLNHIAKLDPFFAGANVTLAWANQYYTEHKKNYAGAFAKSIVVGIQPPIVHNENVDYKFIITYQNVTAGQFVNVFNDNGVSKIRPADNNSGYQAHGYILVNCNIGDVVQVFFEGNNGLVSGAITGAVWLGANGSFAHTRGNGTIVQKIGIATATNNINFENGHIIKI